MDYVNFEIPRETLYQNVEKELTYNIKLIEQIKTSSKEINFNQVILPLEKAQNKLHEYWALVEHLQNVSHEETFREQHQDLLEKITKFYSEVSLDLDLMNLHEKVLMHDVTLTPDAQLALEHAIINFKLAGVDLPQSQKEELKEIHQQLAQLSNTFTEHLMDASDKWVYPCEEETLDGLNQEQKSYFSFQAKQHDVSSPFALTLDGPGYGMAMSYLKNRELREKVYTAYAHRASVLDEVSAAHDNSKIASDILILRAKEAKLLGCNSFNELALKKRFAPSVKAVSDFLNQLIQKVRPFGQKDFKHLVDFTKKESNIDDVQAWDVSFYSEKLKKHTLNYDEHEIKQYFPLNHVLEVMFKTFGELYGFRITPITTSGWHLDVKAYELIDNSTNQSIGVLYCDFFARPKKRSGAWMSGARNKADYADWEQLPVAYLICNFQYQENPTLLFNDVQTLYHEFGHCLHHLLTRRTLPSIAGINEVPWDIVELPSQLHEEWCFDETYLQQLSSHVISKEPLPQDQIQSLLASRHFQASLFLLRQLEFGLFDWKIHEEEHVPADVVSYWQSIRSQVSVTPAFTTHAFPLGFSHIFDGGYAAGYYSYLWAEAYSHQVYAHLKSHQFSRKAGEAFRDSFLSAGGDLDLQEKLHAYLKEKQNLDPLLKSYKLA